MTERERAILEVYLERLDERIKAQERFFGRVPGVIQAEVGRHQRQCAEHVVGPLRQAVEDLQVVARELQLAQARTNGAAQERRRLWRRLSTTGKVVVGVLSTIATGLGIVVTILALT